jgi:hypothetical protein
MWGREINEKHWEDGPVFRMAMVTKHPTFRTAVVSRPVGWGLSRTY